MTSNRGNPRGSFPPPQLEWDDPVVQAGPPSDPSQSGDDEGQRTSTEPQPTRQQYRPPSQPQQAPPQQEGGYQQHPPSTSGNGATNSPFSQNTVMGGASLLDELGSSRTEFIRPERGWRRAMYDLTRGRWNPGLSTDEKTRLDLVEHIQAPLSNKVAHVMVWSQKGGVGKTTTLTALGVTTASNRTDKVLGLDVNPDGGSLAVRVPRTTNLNILDLRDALRQGPLTPVDFDRYVNKASHRFDTITMPPGKKPTQPLSGGDYKMISAALRERYPYKIIYVDCGTDLSAPVMDGVLEQVNQLVVVTTTLKDEATVTAGGLEALVREGRKDLVDNAITVLVEKSPKDPDVRIQQEIDRTSATIKDYFERLTASVIPIPYDSRVRLGEVFNQDEVTAESQMSYLSLTATTIDALRGAR